MHLVNGDLPVAGGAPPEKLDLSRWTIFLPTRRAARALAEIFLKISGESALLLPRIRPLGDVDEDALALSAPPEAGGEARLALHNNSSRRRFTTSRARYTRIFNALTPSSSSSAIS